MSERELSQVAETTARYLMILQKEYLTVEEAAIYMGQTVSFIYGMTSPRGNQPPRVSHYKTGKTIFIPRTELDDYMTQNRIKSAYELELDVTAACL